MDRFLVPAAASIVVGLLLGAAAIFGVTLMVQQDSKPPLQAGDPASSVLNRVEYGNRTYRDRAAVAALAVGVRRGGADPDFRPVARTDLARHEARSHR